MELVCLIISSVMAALYIIFSIRAGKYDVMMENLDSGQYPLKSIYSIGMVLKGIKIFDIPKSVYEKLMGQAKLLYDAKYAEYYVTIRWAQMLSFTYLLLTVGLAVVAVLKSGLYLFVAILLAVTIGYYFYSLMETEIKNRAMECNIELPEVVSTMALLINSGMVLKEAWETVAYSKEGEIYKLMQDACIHMQNGMSETDAIYLFGNLSNSTEIKKFTSSIIQGVEKGSSELSIILEKQSSEMWDVKRQYMLQKGEAAASKLIGPIAFIFIGVIILVIAGAVGMLAT